MLLEPHRAARLSASSGSVAERQPVPGSGFVEPPHLLSESGKPMIKVRAWLQPERLDRKRLGVDRPQLLEGNLGSRVQLVDLVKLGGFARGSKHRSKPIAHDPVEGLERKGPAVGR